MISALFILNQKGEVLISRLFRPDLKCALFSPSPSTCAQSRPPRRRSISDIFRIHVVASSTPPTSPLITLSNTTFFHVRHGGLWIVAVCKHVNLESFPTYFVGSRRLMFPLYRQNANAALVFEFIYRFINLGRSYFGKLDEESVKNNFVCVPLPLRPASFAPLSRLPSDLKLTLSLSQPNLRAPGWFVRLSAPPSSESCSSLLFAAEILDFGYPQNSESDTLKMYITTEGVKSEQAVVRFLLLLLARL